MRKHLFCLLMLLSTLSFAQIQVLTKGLQPIEGAQLQSGSKVVAVSNSNGIIILDTARLQLTDYVVFHESFHLKTLSRQQLITGGGIILSAKTQSFPPVVVLPKKGTRKQTDVSLLVEQLKRKEIQFNQPLTSADLVGVNGNVYVQKSQQGGGSPMIRGFATNRILLVVDNVRMNTAIFRGGNLQNILSIDPFSVEESTVIFGPASQLYGSDALGGVLSFKTKEPEFSKDSTALFFGNLNLRASTASRENTWHIDFNVGGENLASLTSLTFSKFGDLRMGNNGPEYYTRDQFVSRIEGIDTVLTNPNPNQQFLSRYTQVNALQKLKYKLNEQQSLTYNFQLGYTSDIPRYDRLILIDENDSLVNGDWYYGPQFWMLNQLAFQSNKESKLSDRVYIGLSNQQFEESRNDRKFGSAELAQRTENVDAWSLNIDAQKELTNNVKLNYGAESVLNRIASRGEVLNIDNGNLTPTSTRYPDGSKWLTAGVYINGLKNITSKYLVEGGVRYNLTSSSGVFDTNYYPFPESSFSNTTQALTGSLSQIFKFKLSKLAFITSTGFRAPNIDDLSKVFDSNPGLVVLPNTTLKSEYAYNAEINYNLIVKGKLKLGVSVFYTYLNNAITKSRTTFNGQDSIVYDGVLSAVEMLTNQDFASVYGSQINLNYEINEHFLLTSNFTLLASDSKDGLPIRHISPNFGNTTLRYTKDKLRIILFSNYNQRFDFDQFALSERNDAYLYLKDDNGNPYSPSWFTLSLRGAYELNNRSIINLGIENMLNKRYRPYRSGITAAGRNFTVSFSHIFK